MEWYLYLYLCIRQLYNVITNEKVPDLDTATSANMGERTTNAEGVFELCAGDRILVIVKPDLF